MAVKKRKHSEYSSSTSKTVKRVMHEQKEGKLKSGSSKKKVTSRKQAIAIALSEARAAGKKVPPRREARKTSKKPARKTSSR